MKLRLYLLMKKLTKVQRKMAKQNQNPKKSKRNP